MLKKHTLTPAQATALGWVDNPFAEPRPTVMVDQWGFERDEKTGLIVLYNSDESRVVIGDNKWVLSLSNYSTRPWSRQHGGWEYIDEAAYKGACKVLTKILPEVGQMVYLPKLKRYVKVVALDDFGRHFAYIERKGGPEVKWAGEWETV